MAKQDREEKKLKKKLKLEQKTAKLKQTLLNTTAVLKSPKFGALPEIEKKPKYVDDERKEFLEKQPKLNSCPSNFTLPMTWCARASDKVEKWSWHEERRWTNEEWASEISRELNSLEGQTWSDIAKMTTGTAKKRGKQRKKHHPQLVSDITKEAQKRWKHLELEEFDTAYRFRLGGEKRAWGFRIGAHFYLIWYERHHKIYPV